MRDTKTANQTQQAPSEKKTFKRRRCQNCNALYMPTREDQKFCRTLPDPDKCRKEFYRYGSSYGPLKTGLHKAIDKKCADMEKGLWRTFGLKIDQERREVKEWIVQVKELRSQIEKLLLVERSQPDAKPEAR